MKRQFFLVLILFFGMVGYSQNYDFTKRIYNYDNAGNRVLRMVFELPSPSPKHKSAGSQSGADDEDFYMDKVGDISLKIFPNPTTSVVTLQIEGEQSEIEGTVTLYNLQGAKIGEQRINSYRTEVDLSAYPVGAYLATVLINGKTTHWKIVKN